MLAALGLFVFDTDSLPFAELSRKQDWRYARSERIGVRDGFQYVGPGQDRITITGALVPGVAGSFAAIETLVDMGEAGDVHQLADGSGRVWGGFVIQALDTRRKHLMIDGTPRWVDFAIDLERAT